MKRRAWIGCMVCLLWVSSVGAEEFRLMAFEGVAAQQSALDAPAKYGPLATALLAGLGSRGKPAVRSSQSFAGLKALLDKDKDPFEIVFVRPSTSAAELIASYGFQPVVVAEGQAGVAFVVRGDSKLRSLREAAGARLILPDADGAIGKLGIAEVRALGLEGSFAKTDHTRLQEVVLFTLESGLADVGAVNYQQAAQFEKKGGRIVHKGKPVPSWTILASRRFSAADIAKMQDATAALARTESGKEVLKLAGVTAFKTVTAEPYLEVLERIKPRP